MLVCVTVWLFRDDPDDLTGCPRQANSGVGRVSQWLAHHLPAMDRQHEYLFLVSPHSDLKSFHVPADRCVHTHVVPFAGGEFEQLPAEIDALGVDLYVNPQTTWSPLLRTPSISLVHDLGPSIVQIGFPVKTILRLVFVSRTWVICIN